MAGRSRCDLASWLFKLTHNPVFRVKRMRGLRLTGGTLNRNSTGAHCALAA